MKIAAIAGRYGKKEIPSEKAGVVWVWVDHPTAFSEHTDAVCFIDLAFIPEKERILQLSRLLPAPVIVDSVTHTLEEIGQPFIRLNAWPGCFEKGIHELAVSGTESRTQVELLYERLGWTHRIVPDIPGMVSCRILATIINEAYYTLQSEVSTREEIDAAMRLGTNYPYGPFEWSKLIGEDRVFELLMRMGREHDRYLPAEAFSNTPGRN